MPMKELLENSYLFSANAPFMEAQYVEYLRNPEAVSEDWQTFFRELQRAAPDREPDHAAIRAEFARPVKPSAATALKPTMFRL